MLNDAALAIERQGATICRRRQGTIVSIAAFDDRRELLAMLSGLTGASIPDRCRSSTGHSVVLLAYSPARWLALTDAAEGAARLFAFAVACRPYAAVVDQSHGWVCLHITGPRCRDVLAAGSSLDFRSRSFSAGHCAATALGKISVFIHALPASDGFDIYVPRSFAGSLSNWMRRVLASIQD